MNQIINNKYFKWIVLIIEGLLYYFLFIHKKIIDFDIISHFIMAALIILNWYCLFYKSINKVKLNKIEFLFLIIINLAISFFVSGKVLFLTNHIFSISIRVIIRYLLVNLFVFPFVYNIIYLFDNITIVNDKKENKDSKKFALKVFIFTFACLLAVCLIYYPGNITSDTLDMINQAQGNYAINDAHSAFYTIIIRYLLRIWNTPFVLMFSNTIFLSLLITHIYKYLYEQNISKKALWISLLIFNLSINNILLMSMAWKDIPFTIAMLWLTFEVYKISKEKDEYFKKILNIVFLCISLLITFFIRHNGMFPYYIVIVYLLYLLIKSKERVRIIVTIIISISSVLIVKGPVFSHYDVQKSNIMTVGSASFAAKGLASLVYYDADIDEKDQETIYSIISQEDFKKYYNPYSMNEYSFTAKGWNEGLEKVGVAKIYELYIKYFFRRPDIIIRDRLDGCNLVWSYVTPDGGYNMTYDVGIHYVDWLDEFEGFERNEGSRYIPKATIFRKAVSAYQTAAENVVVLNIIFWRLGLTLSILLLAFYFAIIRKINVIPAFLPTLISVLFWVALMGSQDYRYLWFMYLNTIFLVLVMLGEKKKVKNKVVRK